MRSSRWQQQYTEQYQQRENLDSVRGASPRLQQAMPTVDASIVSKGGAGDRLISQALGAGHDLAKTAFKVALHEQEEERALKATEIVNNWRSGLNQFQADYTQNKQGELAANAGPEFSAFARQSGNEVLESIRDDKLRNMVMKSMSGLSMHFEETGLHYGNQQMAARKKSVLDGQFSQLLQDAGQNATNPDFINHQLADYAQRYNEAHPGLDTSAHMAEVKRKVLMTQFAALEANEDVAGMEAFQGKMGGQVGSLTARQESGNNPATIGYDRVGGTSYGTYQISSGSMYDFMHWLVKQGEEGIAVAQRLSAAGKPNTGSKDGAMPQAWKELAAQGKIQGFEREYIMQTHFGPVMDSLPDGVKSLVDQNPALQDLIFDTSVQHGPGGAKKLIARAAKNSDGTPAGFINALSDDRKTQFGGSTPEVQASVFNRIDRVRGATLGGALHASDIAHIGRAIKAGRERQEKEWTFNTADNLARTYADNPQEGMRRIEGLAPDLRTREMLEKSFMEQLGQNERIQAFQKRAEQANELKQAELAVRQPEFLALSKEDQVRVANNIYVNTSDEMKPKAMKVLNKALGINTREINDPVSYEQARRDILGGMPLEQVRALHYNMISDIKWEQLQTLAESKDEQRAAQADDEYFAYYWQKSGIPDDYTGSNKYKADVFRAQIKMEYGEFLRSGNKTKSLKEREEWLFEKLAKRTDGSFFFGSYDPIKASKNQEKELYLEVPDEYLPTIQAYMKEKGLKDTKENIHASYRKLRHRLRGAQ